MPAVNTYPSGYVAACRKRIDAQIAAYLNLADGSSPEVRSAFDEQFFANLVLVLQQMFADRARGREGKDGNALNEVRAIAVSVLDHDGRMAVDETTKLKATTSVLGFEPGERIVLDTDRFARLSAAYFVEIEARFS